MMFSLETKRSTSVFHGTLLARTPQQRQTTITATTGITYSMKRVNIQLASSTHTQAKILAVLQGKTLNDYLAEAVEKQVKKDEGLLTTLSKKAR